LKASHLFDFLVTQLTCKILFMTDFINVKDPIGPIETIALCFSFHPVTQLAHIGIERMISMGCEEIALEAEVTGTN
jgi:hypothetical protein